MSSNRLKNNVIKAARPENIYLWNISTILQKLAPALFIVLSIALIIFSNINKDLIKNMRTYVIDVISPVLTLSSAPVISLVNSIDDVSALRDLKAKNIFLEGENKKLTKWYGVALKLQAENKSLRDLLNVKPDKTLNFITARVISDAGTTFVKTILLPIGTNDKVENGDAVMSGQGFIGRIAEVGNKSSRVLLITDLNSRIPVIIENTGTKAILSGKNKNLLKLDYLPHDSPIIIGSRIVTSGDGEKLIPDIPIGIIISSNIDGVWVKPLSNIPKLKYVQVINTNININKDIISGNIVK